MGAQCAVDIGHGQTPPIQYSTQYIVTFIVDPVLEECGTVTGDLADNHTLRQ